MNRRELVKNIALLTGAAVAGSEFFLSGCKSKEAVPGNYYAAEDISFFDEVAETIIPETGTPGAKDAAVGAFMALYAADCYSEPDRKILKEGINKLNDESGKKYKVAFIAITPAQKKDLLTEIDAEAKKYNENSGNQSAEKHPPHYFTLMKQLVLLGFFTSKPGVTKVLRYMPVPGKYEGCIDYKDGETSWA
jgi:hypothetical protein